MLTIVVGMQQDESGSANKMLARRGMATPPRRHASESRLRDEGGGEKKTTRNDSSVASASADSRADGALQRQLDNGEVEGE